MRAIRRLNGLRLLDYARNSPEKHRLLSYPRAEALLEANIGRKYNSVDNDLEVATALLHNLNLPAESRVNSAFERLNIDIEKEQLEFESRSPQSSIIKLIANKGHSIEQLQRWLACFEAQSITQCLECMKKESRWPDFLLLYTLHRRCESPREAYDAIRLYQQQFCHMKPKFQVEATILAIRLAQKYVVDLAPVIARIYITEASIEAKTVRSYNEIIWSLAKFGTSWSVRDSHILMAAQRSILQGLKHRKLKVNGTVGIAYLGHFSSPDLARDLIKGLPTLDKGGFAKVSGKHAIEILTMDSAVDAIKKMESLDVKHQTSFMWGLLVNSLRNKGLITPKLALGIWNFVVSSAKHRVGSYLAAGVLLSLSSWHDKLKVLRDMKIIGLKLNARLVKALVPHTSLQDLVEFKHELESSDLLKSPVVIEAILQAECHWSKQTVWNTYKDYRIPPNRSVLQSLCRAACDPLVVWDGLYAPQRALAELRIWLRGMQNSGNDMLRIYPDEGLLCAYLEMCAKAHYDNELIGFMGWLEQLHFKPTKRMLLILLDASPQGPALMKLGQLSRQAGDDIQWPTQQELDLFRLQRQKFDQSSPANSSKPD